MSRRHPKGITIRPEATMQHYLRAIVDEGGLGETHEEVVERLVWEGIRNLIRDGWIDRQKIEAAQ